MNELTAQKLLRLQNEVDQLLHHLQTIKAQRQAAPLTLVAESAAPELNVTSQEVSAA